ncbi:MAG: hypothetical protein ACJ72W_16680 [Actinoallomurus sp.]
MFSRRTRKSSLRAGAATLLTAAAAVAVTGLGTTEAMAAPKTHSHGGDNGTVKIHRSTTSVTDPRNEPHVCGFYLDGFHFDAGQQVSWSIVSWPPTGNRTEVLHGALTLGQDGNGRTTDLSLPNGHYKLYWNFAGEHGRAKQKVFWVKCDGSLPTPPGGNGNPPEPSPTSSATASPAPTLTGSPGPSPSSTTQPPAPAPTPVPSDLPVTG